MLVVYEGPQQFLMCPHMQAASTCHVKCSYMPSSYLIQGPECKGETW